MIGLFAAILTASTISVISYIGQKYSKNYKKNDFESTTKSEIFYFSRLAILFSLLTGMLAFGGILIVDDRFSICSESNSQALKCRYPWLVEAIIGTFISSIWIFVISFILFLFLANIKEIIENSNQRKKHLGIYKSIFLLAPSQSLFSLFVAFIAGAISNTLFSDENFTFGFLVGLIILLTFISLFFQRFVLLYPLSNTIQRIVFFCMLSISIPIMIIIGSGIGIPML